MIRRRIGGVTALVLGTVSILVLLASYTYLSHRQHVINPTDTTIPTWAQLKQGVTAALADDKWTGESWLWADSKASLSRLFSGLGIGLAVALVAGLMMGCWGQAEAFLHPPLSLLAKVPLTAAMPVFFVMVGTGTNMYVAMIACGMFPTLALSVYLAVKEFPDELQFKAYTLGASHMEVIVTCIFRYVLPKLIDAARLSIGPAMVYLIAGEMLVGDVGFGYRIRLQGKLVNMSVVYPYITLLAAFGFGMDYALRFLQRKLCPWYEGHRG